MGKSSVTVSTNWLAYLCRFVHFRLVFRPLFLDAFQVELGSLQCLVVFNPDAREETVVEADGVHAHGGDHTLLEVRQDRLQKFLLAGEIVWIGEQGVFQTRILRTKERRVRCVRQKGAWLSRAPVSSSGARAVAPKKLRVVGDEGLRNDDGVSRRDAERVGAEEKRGFHILAEESSNSRQRQQQQQGACNNLLADYGTSSQQQC